MAGPTSGDCATGPSPRPIRVLYRLQAIPGQEDSLIDEFRPAGASSSLLLRRRGDRSSFLAVVGWRSCADWREHRRVARPGSELGAGVERLARNADRISVEALEEVEDRLDEGPGRTTVRLYRVVVAPGDEDTFREAWIEESETREVHAGARGSLLLQAPGEPHAFVELVRWGSDRDWQASVRAGPGPFDAYDTLFWVRTLVSKEIYDEVSVPREG
jgi:hypothetical protein